MKRWGLTIAGALAIGWTLMTVVEPLVPSFNPNGQPPGPWFQPLYLLPAALAALGAYLFRRERTLLGTLATALPALGCLICIPFVLTLLVVMVALA